MRLAEKQTQLEDNWRKCPNVYGYPKKDAAKIAIETVKLFPANFIKKMVFCCFSEEDAAIYREITS